MITEDLLHLAIEWINRHQPDKSIDLLDSAATQARRYGKTVLDAEDLRITLARLNRIFSELILKVI